MSQIIKLKRSIQPGSKPTTSNLDIAEIALNVNDGKAFLRKSGSTVGDSIKEFVTIDHEGTLTGSLNLFGDITASYFIGNGSRLTNLTVSQVATIKDTYTNSSVWNVNHNLDSDSPIVQVYDSNDFQIIPTNIQILNRNNVRITFPTNQSGYVVVAQGGHMISGSIPADNIVGFNTKVKTKLNTEGVFSGSSQVSLGGDVTGTADVSVISSINGGLF